jgi:hypothetical protein
VHIAKRDETNLTQQKNNFLQKKKEKEKGKKKKKLPQVI